LEEKKSELRQLLEKNAYGERLTKEEKIRAVKLITNPVLSNKDCWVCEVLCPVLCPDNVPKTIFDTGICQYHASYELAIRK